MILRSIASLVSNVFVDTARMDRYKYLTLYISHFIDANYYTFAMQIIYSYLVFSYIFTTTLRCLLFDFAPLLQ